MPGGPERPLGEEGAEALPPPDLVDEADQRSGIAPGEIQATGVFRRDPAPLVALHGEPYHGAGRDCVDPQAVCDVVRLRHGLRVVDERVRAHHPQSLVFGAGPGERVLGGSVISIFRWQPVGQYLQGSGLARRTWV